MEPVLTLPRGRPLTEADLAASPWTSARYEVVDESLVVTSTGAPFTRAELDRLPDDGWRHELIDGALVMTPSPSYRHQTIVPQLWTLLRQAAPDGFAVVIGPYDVEVTRPDGSVQVFVPDLVVARMSDITNRQLPVAPLLAVEVQSPSTRRIDLGRKFAAFEAAGVTSYWVVDQAGPRLRAWGLRDGGYVEVADVGPDESWAASLPFEVVVRPGELVD
jgi:Uma2 family endonuclease